MNFIKMIFGFRGVDLKRIKGKNPIDEGELIKVLATLQANQNWLIRGFWLLVGAIIGTNIMS